MVRTKNIVDNLDLPHLKWNQAWQPRAGDSLSRLGRYLDRPSRHRRCAAARAAL